MNQTFLNLSLSAVSMYISISKTAYMLGISATTLRRWDASGHLKPAFRTFGRHRRYKITTILEITGQLQPQNNENRSHHQQKVQVVSYARVSSSKQRHDLERQLQHLESYVNAQHWHLLKSYKDIGSGINDKRKGLLQLIKDLPVLQPQFVLCSYYDRLSRFGVTLLETVCSLFSTKIITTHTIAKEKQSNNQELVDNIVAILYSFSGKLYRARRGKQQICSS